MPLLARIRSAARNLVARTAMVFGRYQQRYGSGWLGSTRFDYQSEVNPATSSIVMAVVFWIMRTFPEAPPRVSRRSGIELTPVPDHRLIQLLRRPNPYYSGILLWMATIVSWMLTGNAYWIKVRSQIGQPVELWWIPPQLIKPAWPDDGSEFISHYEYRPDSRYEAIKYAPTEIVHFRYGLDPDNPRLGLSPMAALIREIFTDDQGANFTAALLRNLGVPGIVIAPDDQGTEIGEEAAEHIKADVRSKFGGDRRGEPLIMTSKTKVTVLSFSPEQMSLKDLRRLPEERVTAVTGVNAMVVGLGAGLDHSTYSNYGEAREAAFESNIIPSQRMMAEDLRVQLLVDFEDINKFEFDFDLSNVRVLQDDQDKLYARLTRSLVAGGMPLNTYLRKTNQDEIGPDGDVLYVPRNITPTKPADLLAEPVAPEPAPLPGTTPLPTPVAPSRNGATNGHVAQPVPA